jgi:hypothetical protein
MVKGSVEVRGAVSLKSLLPLIPREVMVAGVTPVLVSTTERVLLDPTVTLPKARLMALRENEDGAPVPVSPTVVKVPTVPPLLELMVSVSVRSPADPGLNWTKTWALPPGRMLLAEFGTVKPAPPPTVIDEMARFAVRLVLLMVNGKVALLPRATVPKARFGGLTPITGIPDVTDACNARGMFPPLESIVRVSG